MTPLEARAWELYCEETAGNMDVRDFWHELHPKTQKRYLMMAEAEAYQPKPEPEPKSKISTSLIIWGVLVLLFVRFCVRPEMWI